eukprot:g2736.t1
MSYTVSCDAKPVELENDGCGGWKCQYYNCSVNEAPAEPRCMCFCRYGLALSCITLLIYFVLFIISWKRQVTGARIILTFALTAATGLVCIAIFTNHCDEVTIAAIVEVALLSCCLTCLCPSMMSNQSNDAEAPLLGEQHNQNETPTASCQTIIYDSESCPALVVGPDGDAQLAVPELHQTSKAQ